MFAGIPGGKKIFEAARVDGVEMESFIVIHFK